jgi:integrase
MRNEYTLYSRKVPSGKRVYYYYAYDDDGNRLGPWSTREENKTAARNHCNGQIRKGVLVPGIKGMSTFAVFASDFWDWEKSEYLKDRRKRNKLTKGYADKCKRQVDFTLTPYFGKMRLDRITGEVIDKWQDYMIASGYEHSTINGYYGTLMTMMKWAVKKRYIVRDPFLDVERLLDEKKEKQLITREEFKTMFVTDWERIWQNDLLLCTANKLAALTGMRVSEILGIKGKDVFDDHIYVAFQYDKELGDRETKTKTKDNIPLTSELISDLRKLMLLNRDGYLFSLSGGEKPVTVRHIYNGLIRALKRMGLTQEEIKKRGLNVHAWRHFCNTEMLNAGIPLKKVQAITRHKSERMTDRYTHFDPLEFVEAVDFQSNLLQKAYRTAETSGNEMPRLTILKSAEIEKELQKKVS